MKKNIFITILLSTLLIIGIIFYFLILGGPVKKILRFKNCSISYYSYLCGSGNIKGGLFHFHNFYPNDFWEHRAKAILMNCLCDEYLKNNNSQIKDEIIDVITKDDDFLFKYCEVIDKKELINRFITMICNNEIQINDKFIANSIDSLCTSLKLKNDTILVDKILQKLIKNNRFDIFLNQVRQDKSFKINIDVVCNQRFVIFEEIPKE